MNAFGIRMFGPAFWQLLSIFSLLCDIGCGAGGASTPGDAASPGSGLLDARQPATSGRYIPLSVGAAWTWNGYDTLSGASGPTDSHVEALETLTGAKAGKSAFRVRSATLVGSTVNWQEDTGTAVVRHREQFFDAGGLLKSDHLFTPNKLRLDESAARTALNASWVETYTDVANASTTITVAWTVEAVDEMVTVPAGTFSCLRVHAVQAGGAAYDSTFWFARNVGKVKEAGTEVRQLVGYRIP
jgi:hypothetical protein